MIHNFLFSCISFQLFLYSCHYFPLISNSHYSGFYPHQATEIALVQVTSGLSGFLSVLVCLGYQEPSTQSRPQLSPPYSLYSRHCGLTDFGSTRGSFLPRAFCMFCNSSLEGSSSQFLLPLHPVNLFSSFRTQHKCHRVR